MNDNGCKPTMIDAGIPVQNGELSLTIRPDGPILLQDHYLIEQMVLRQWAADDGRKVRPEQLADIFPSLTPD
jgi:catalase